jgi:hypothetical protein
MKKKLLIITGIILSIFLIGALYLTVSAEEDYGYFNQVELFESNGNTITNNRLPSYYDTILSVGLSSQGIMGSYVVVDKLSDEAKEQFNGELKAHVRFFDGVYYLYIDEMSRGEAIKVISHEIIHIYQYNSGQLFYENGEITWNFKKYDLSSLDYDNRPWEKEAFDNEDVLSKKIFEALY